jgi:hypothetical protein
MHKSLDKGNRKAKLHGMVLGASEHKGLRLTKEIPACREFPALLKRHFNSRQRQQQS